MFHSTRIKLTFWYLLIIMVVSGLFSALIYFGASQELERGFRRAQARMEAEKWFDMVVPKDSNGMFFRKHIEGNNMEDDLPFLFVEDLQKAKDMLFMELLIINGAIWILAAIASYYFAGLSLRPIETALEEQKRFVSDASHELRTPVTALKTALEVNMGDKKISNYAKKVLKDNLEDVLKMEKLVDGLLKLSRSNGKLQKSFEEVDMKLLLLGSLKILKPLVEKRNHKLVKKFDGDNFVIQGVEQSLSELVMILVENAIKYTPDKGRIVVSLIRQKKNILLKVKDNGRGVAKKDRLHIFDRFYRVDDARCKEDVEGFGLGLALAKKIVDQHVGDISVKSPVLKKSERSDARKGTMFVVKLPLG